MSIINEALKKTDQSIHKNLIKEPLPATSKPAIKSYAIYALILIAGLLLSNFIFTLISRKAKSTVIAKINPETSALPVQEIKTTPFVPAVPAEPDLKEVKAPEINFVLSGIFFSDDDSYALVNNKIVRENEFVDGAKVKTISENSVELDNAGKTVTLATQR